MLLIGYHSTVKFKVYGGSLMEEIGKLPSGLFIPCYATLLTVLPETSTICRARQHVLKFICILAKHAKLASNFCIQQRRLG